jgi:hypothetical protein
MNESGGGFGGGGGNGGGGGGGEGIVIQLQAIPPPPAAALKALKPLNLCSSSADLVVGQKVFAIGNPFGALVITAGVGDLGCFEQPGLGVAPRRPKPPQPAATSSSLCLATSPPPTPTPPRPRPHAHHGGRQRHGARDPVNQRAAHPGWAPPLFFSRRRRPGLCFAAATPDPSANFLNQPSNNINSYHPSNQPSQSYIHIPPRT